MCPLRFFADDWPRAWMRRAAGHANHGIHEAIEELLRSILRRAQALLRDIDGGALQGETLKVLLDSADRFGAAEQQPTAG